MSLVACHKCGKNSRNGLCAKCRYLENVDKYRKTNTCEECDKVVLKTSTLCKSCSQKGSRNPYWRGGHDRSLYSSKEWKNWRKLVFAACQHRCVLCGTKESWRFHAHHIRPKRSHAELLFEVSNGVVLCHGCHSQVHLKEYDYIDLLDQAVLKLRELGEPCNGNTEPSSNRNVGEGVETRGEPKPSGKVIKTSTSAGHCSLR